MVYDRDPDAQRATRWAERLGVYAVYGFAAIVMTSCLW